MNSYRPQLNSYRPQMNSYRPQMNSYQQPPVQMHRPLTPHYNAQPNLNPGRQLQSQQMGAVQRPNPVPVPEFNWTPLPAHEMARHPIGQSNQDRPMPSVLAKPMEKITRVIHQTPPSPISAPQSQTVPPPPAVDISVPPPVVRNPAPAADAAQPQNQTGRVLREITSNGHMMIPKQKQAGHQYHNTAQRALYYPPTFLSALENIPKVPLQNRLKVRVTATTVPASTESRDSGNYTVSRIREKSIKPEYPILQEENHDLAIRLHEMLQEFPGGVMEKHLPEVFRQTTGTSLPQHWTSVLSAYSRLFSIEIGPLAHLVYANDLTAEEKDAESADEEVGTCIQLPWSDKHWNVFVTHVTATTMIWARLIGPNYSDRMDQLMANLESTMALEENKKTVVTAEVLKVYLVAREACWFRVRCQEVDSEGKQILAFYMDQGHEEWVDVNMLLECDDKFQRLPAQAVLFTMFGMESMEGNPYAKPILERKLNDRTVVAEILTRAEDYEEGMRVKAVLYDTSSADDINLVELLHSEICDAAEAPQLAAVGTTQQVKIAHVSDRGDVFCQLPGSGFDYVQKLIQATVQQKETLSRNRGLKENGAAGDAATRYLVLDRLTDTWYRAVLKVRHPSTARHVMYCLDYGTQMEIAEEDIYHLAPMNMALSRFPAMAIRCELHDIPKVNSRIVARIKGLLDKDCLALTKVMVSPGMDKIPRVNFYRRFDTNKVIVCINETLRLELDFESKFAV